MFHRCFGILVIALLVLVCKFLESALVVFMLAILHAHILVEMNVLVYTVAYSY